MYNKNKNNTSLLGLLRLMATVLNKINFSVVPDRIPHVELITATDRLNQLDSTEADELRAL